MEEEAGKKRDHKRDREAGAATEEWKKQQMAELRRRGKEESERYMANFRAKYPNEDLSDLLAFQAREYRESASTGKASGQVYSVPSRPPRQSHPCASRIISLCRAMLKSMILCKSFQSKSKKQTRAYSGRSRCLASLLLATQLIAIAISSSTVRGITVKSSHERFVLLMFPSSYHMPYAFA
ncbi:unnamed protein product [Urochloa humidicola]